VDAMAGLAAPGETVRATPITLPMPPPPAVEEADERFEVEGGVPSVRVELEADDGLEARFAEEDEEDEELLP
jgi:hypothetical protein